MPLKITVICSVAFSPFLTIHILWNWLLVTPMNVLGLYHRDLTVCTILHAKRANSLCCLGLKRPRSLRAVWLYTVASLGSSHRYQIDHICHLGGCWWFLCSKVLPKYFPLPKELYAWNIHRQGPKGLWLVSPCKNACILQEIILLFFPSFFVDYWFWLFYSYPSLVHRLSARSLLS